jgi:hypothetical protein
MKKRIRRCDQARRQQWRMAIQQWQSSGQSVRAFCRQEGLKESAFFFGGGNWRSRIGQTPLRLPRLRASGKLRRRSSRPVPRRIFCRSNWSPDAIREEQATSKLF